MATTEKPCANVKHAVAGLRAAGQLTGDIFSEAERLKALNTDQQAVYERSMAFLMGKPPQKGTYRSSALEVLSKGEKGKRPGLLSDGLYARPSETLSKKFYDGVDRKITAWAKTGEKATLETYRQNVAKPVRTLLGAVDKIMKESATPAMANAKLKRLGLDVNQVYQARSWLQWLADGGHMKPASNPWIAGINTAGKNLSKAQANLNLVWTMGNGVDLLRVMPHFATKKNGVMNTFKGLGMLAKETKGNPFARIKELEQAGIYHSDYTDRGGKNTGLFEMSITAQKNLVYFLDKASGGNGITGIRDVVFDSKPWDRPLYDRSPDAQLLLGLARYPINETRWLFKTLNDVRKGDMRQTANLALFMGLRTVITGTSSLIPAFVWQGMSKEQKEGIKQAEKEAGINLVARTTGGNVDVAEYVQPGGGSLGARAQMLGSSFNKAGANATQAVTRLGEGKVGAAAFNALAAAWALTNLTNFNKIGDKLGVWNSTTVTKLLDTTADQLAGEFKKPGKYEREITKDLLGGTAKNPDNENNVVNMARPSRPARPQRPRAGF